jgi:hypothetical protein
MPGVRKALWNWFAVRWRAKPAMRPSRAGCRRPTVRGRGKVRLRVECRELRDCNARTEKTFRRSLLKCDRISVRLLIHPPLGRGFTADRDQRLTLARTETRRGRDEVPLVPIWFLYASLARAGRRASDGCALRTNAGRRELWWRLEVWGRRDRYGDERDLVPTTHSALNFSSPPSGHRSTDRSSPCRPGDACRVPS